LENDGSQNASVQLSFSNDADTFIGGDSGINDYRFVVSQNGTQENGSCTNSTGGYGEPVGTCTTNADDSTCLVGPTGWAAPNTTSPGNIICQKLLPDNANDSILVGVNITIPFNAPSGAKSSTLTATATSVS